MKQKKGYPRKPYSFERVLKDLADEVGYDSLEKIIDKKRNLVVGQVVLKIFKGNVIILSRRSNNKAYSMKKVSFEENKHFNKKKVENFIKYHAKKL